MGQHNLRTRETKIYQRTYRLPQEFIDKKKATKNFLSDCKKQFQDEVDKLSLGTIVKQEKIKLIDYARDYVEGIKKADTESYHRYSMHKMNLKVLDDRLGGYYLHEINKNIVLNLFGWLSARTYIKTTVKVIKSLKPLIKTKKLLLNVASDCICLTERYM